MPLDRAKPTSESDSQAKHVENLLDEALQETFPASDPIAVHPDAERRPAAWPELPYAAWRDTCATLHLWTQIVGKIRNAKTPWLNHSWHVPLYVGPRGLTTSIIPDASSPFEIEFDFVDHKLIVATSDGQRGETPLEPRSVADFFAAVMTQLGALGIQTRIDDFPCEIPGAIRFSQDRTHASYDPDYAERFWRVLVQADRVFKAFRTRFIGKASSVHFFWGSFDLAVTRFSGRTAPPHPGGVPGLADAIVREAYSHEVSSAGFWPGGPGFEQAAFYSYAYPEPPGFKTATVAPSDAFYSETLREFLLPYDAVRGAADPDEALLTFLQSTYEAAAVSGTWDRTALECAAGQPGVPRPVR